jgi:hypothetical protein
MSLDPTLDVTVDGDVIFRFAVTNRGTEPVELTFRTGQYADVAVYDIETDAIVWQWSDGKMFTQSLERLPLSPGETFEREYTWCDPQSGDYVAIATLEADRDVEARVEVTI